MMILCASCSAIPKFTFPIKKVTARGTNEFLRPAVNDRDAITLEVFHIRIPQRQSETLLQLWRETDEQIVLLDNRKKMAAQGFRVGVQGMSLSPTMARLLELREMKEQSLDDATRAEMMREISPQEMAGNEPLVRLKVVKLYPPNESPVLIEPYSEPLPEFSLFWQEEGRVVGNTYRQAIGVLAITAKKMPDGAVRVEVSPELHYGESRMTYQRIGESGVTPKMQRPQRAFPELKTNVQLLSGQWLILGMNASESCGAGRCFFSRNFGSAEQKLIAIRLVSSGM